MLASVRVATVNGPEASPDAALPSALNKELGKARAMTTVLARRSAELRAEGEKLIKEADKLLYESWNERMWAGGRVTSIWRR